MDRNDVAVARGERAPVNNNAQGWGVATFIVALAIACTVGAWVLHERTYRHPTDPAGQIGGQKTSGH